MLTAFKKHSKFKCYSDYKLMISENNIDFVITLCAEEICPIIKNNAKRIHWPNPDPAIKNITSRQQELLFRETRENIFRMLKKSTFRGFGYRKASQKEVKLVPFVLEALSGESEFLKNVLPPTRELDFHGARDAKK